MLKSRICICYIHASLRTQERHFGSKSFSFGVQMFGNRKIALSRCSWGVSTLELIYVCQTPEKMIHDCLRGYGFSMFFTWIHKVGNKVFFCTVTMLDLHRSDKFKNFVATRSQIAKHVFFCWRHICPCKRVANAALPTKKVSYQRRTKSLLETLGTRTWVPASFIRLRMSILERSGISGFEWSERSGHVRTHKNEASDFPRTGLSCVHQMGMLNANNYTIVTI